jgi:glutamine amidotransferase
VTIIAIIDYGSGNLRSVAKAFERIAQPGGARIEVTRSPAMLATASHIVLPGVGAFADCMAGLRSQGGMLETLQQEILQRKKWFLGICVGMQMLFERGHEHGVYEGLGWLKGEVVSLHTAHSTLKIPHMGWNTLEVARDHPLLRGIASGDHAYFVHGYHARCTDARDVIAATAYGQSIAAVVAKEHIMGTQFHPEKSQDVGLRLLSNFLSL